MKTKVLAIVAVLLILSAPVMAQDFCINDLNYDGVVNPGDTNIFFENFPRSPLQNPCPPDGPAPVEKSGQTTSYATGDDGDLEKGVPWPNPRFTDNLDGTVTDNLTGLIWLKDANCFGLRTWSYALSDCNGLQAGWCGLTDGSNAGDWRLPHYKELFSLVDAKNYNPALPTVHPFADVRSEEYWSSTTYAYHSNYAWYVNMYDGYVGYDAKDFYYRVWCVRGGR